MKIYGIGMKMSERGGHGDPGAGMWAIRPVGPYGSGIYPPLFTRAKDAKAWAQRQQWPFEFKVIALELKTDK